MSISNRLPSNLHQSQCTFQTCTMGYLSQRDSDVCLQIDTKQWSDVIAWLNSFFWSIIITIHPYQLSATITMSTDKLCDVTALFGAFQKTDKHQTLIRSGCPMQLVLCLPKPLFAKQYMDIIKLICILRKNNGEKGHNWWVKALKIQGCVQGSVCSPWISSLNHFNLLIKKMARKWGQETASSKCNSYPVEYSCDEIV